MRRFFIFQSILFDKFYINKIALVKVNILLLLKYGMLKNIPFFIYSL